MFERERVQAFEYNDGTLHLVLSDGKKLTAKVPYLDLFYADLGKLIDEQHSSRNPKGIYL